MVGRRARDRSSSIAYRRFIRVRCRRSANCRIARCRRVIAEQIGVEADDHAGPIEAELGPIRGPECLDAPSRSYAERLVFIPRHLRKRIEKLLANGRPSANYLHR